MSELRLTHQKEVNETRHWVTEKYVQHVFTYRKVKNRQKLIIFCLEIYTLIVISLGQLKGIVTRSLRTEVTHGGMGLGSGPRGFIPSVSCPSAGAQGFTVSELLKLAFFKLEFVNHSRLMFLRKLKIKYQSSFQRYFERTICIWNKTTVNYSAPC